MEDEVREIGGRGMPGARTYLRLVEELRETGGDDEPRIQQYLAHLLRRLHRLSRLDQATEFVRSARLALKQRKFREDAVGTHPSQAVQCCAPPERISVGPPARGS